MRWVNRAGTFLVAVLFVVGPPTVAVTWIRHQHWDWPTLRQAQRWLDQPLSAGTIIAGLALVAATFWLLLTAYLLWRAGRSLAGGWRRVRRMPLPSSAQVTAGSMAGVAAFAMPAVVAPHPDVTIPSVGTAIPHLDGAAAGTDTGDREVPVEQVSVEQAGVELPGGGWLPYRTAVAVTTLSGLVWLYRRHHYRPGPPRFGRHHSDADLQPLPVTVDAITATIGGDDAEPPAAAPATLIDDLPPGRLVLHGPGAIDAGRGLLVTAVLSAALADHVEITVRGQDLLHLVDIGPGRQLPAVKTEPGRPTAAGPPVPGGFEQPTLTITRRPARADELPHPGGPNRDSDPISTDVIIVEDVEGLSGWHVAADGTVTGGGTASPIRLPQLPRQAATDLIGLVQQHQNARNRPHPSTPTTPPPHIRQPAPGRLTMLGGCHLSVHGERVRVHRSAGLQVLAYLAVHPEGATTSDLVRAIWPGNSPGTITARLYTTVTGLRHQLQPELADPIQRDGERYRINPNAIETDLHQIRQALDAVPHAITAEQRHHAARQLTDLYWGELAEGFSWPWLHPAREALRRDLIDAYLHLAQNAEPASVADLIQAAISIDPYNTDLHQRALALLTATGQHTAARDLDHSFTQRLSRAGLHPATDREPPGPSER